EQVAPQGARPAGDGPRPGLGSGVEDVLEASDDGLEDLDAGPTLVVPLDEDPGGGLGAGLLEHLAGGGLVGVPAVAVAPVLVGDLVLLVGGRLAVLEPPELLVGGDRQPELHDDGAELDELLLEGVDLAEG